MTDFNIFDNVKHYQGKFFLPKVIGDQIQGTYVDKQHGLNSFGSPQTIYVLKGKDEAIHFAAFSDTHTKMHEKMALATLGMIVGFKFEGSAPSKKVPGKTTKFINSYFDARFVDQPWIDEQKRLENEARSVLGGLAKPAITPDNFMAGIEEEEGATASVAPSAAEKNDGLAAVRTLAVTKKIVPEGTAPEAIDAKVAEVTGLPVTVENLVPIIVKLTQI
jgi:hypothetical protein